MTAHKATPSHNRRRRSGPSHASSAKRGRKGALWAGIAALTVLGVTGFAAVGWTLPGTGKGTADAGAEPTKSSASSPGPTRPTQSPQSKSPAGRSTSPSTSPSAGRSGGASAGGGTDGGGTAGSSGSPSGGTTEADIPATGPGTFTVADGSSASVGKGTPLRYRVDVEDGLDLSAADVARQVEVVLADPRGWTADGNSAFQRVSSGAVDFVVRVATPGTVDKICLQGGLNTGGEYNCSVNQNVMVNLERWLLATPVYAKDVGAYRALIINHEVGHFLGHNHVTCPGAGKPAPAMMQQIKGMKGCVPNVWPYDDRGQLITGPAVP
ncbi:MULTISPECIES: DUF3152 domain-containing protein [unclassified Streptomyces]|uniref:DUF3152 domain-containing protein n=1 Tax=unclassified Streptomyces TaxID=2593676 RepID=UPI0033344225